MSELRQMRAIFDAETVTVYQAYGPQIADPAVVAQRFVAPFSFTRATWIKPSFAWMMYRSGWATKPGQERVLAIRLRRSDWEAALDRAVLTSHHRQVHDDGKDWSRAVKAAPVRVQWDPERSLHGGDLPYRSIQVGLTRDVVGEYNDWIVGIEDVTPLVRRVHDAVRAGRAAQVRKIAPVERVYPVQPGRFAHLGL